ncbi:phenylalanyl-tRNA synthetase beta chain (plasmid) [Azospirillum sp. B510]|uniref:phenylalanine--tRNA ligase subunit beta n=1 Tax=Azospirillum sp. (strain B510) TaxID=137722 RepID=UPI0001C4B898|nr:phenylalanine--tRNA ligase subunit beta [Azospirillum sp. B510]BAI74132.1 phenylalanyl-tRNA synthetase beta chain [Azospirillum sp. B510]
MLISLNWLGDHVDLTGLAPEGIAERLTVSCAEVEGLTEVKIASDFAVVARILAARPIDGGLELELNAGGGQRVTLRHAAAPGLAEGRHVAYGPPGFPWPNGGECREGGLVSMAALGLGEDVGPILCPADASPGTPLSRFIPTGDTLIEIDNKSATHRPDLWGVYGFARELAAILRRPLTPLDTADLPRFGDLPDLPVANEAAGDCEVLTGFAVDVADLPVTPLPVQARLALMGIRSAGILVDATNYVMLETGQPTHAYDRDVVSGLAVRMAGKARDFVTLDGRGRRLEPEDLVVFAGDTPVGLAGIMGGARSAVGDGSTRILIEAAQFRAARVRRTAGRLGLRTEASQRFEKSLAPGMASLAQARIFRLLEAWGAAPAARSRLCVQGDAGLTPRRITMRTDEISRNAGTAIPDAEIDRILGALGFGIERGDGQLAVTVPPHRSRQDIGLPIDIVEEVLRIFGYANIAPRLPTARIAPVDPNAGQMRQRKIRRLLSTGHGFAEVQTYLWTDDTWLREIGYEPEGALRLRNPVAPDKGRLRTTLVPNLLDVARSNAGHRTDCAIYEIGRVVLPSTTPHREVDRLCGVSLRAGRDDTLESHYREIKGILEKIVAATGRGRLRTLPIEPPDATLPWQVPDLTATLADDTGPIGTIGVLYGPIRDKVATGRQVVWFEVDLERLTQPGYPAAAFRPFSEYPGSTQDFSVLWNPERGFAALETVLEGFTHRLVRKREFLMTYRSKDLGPDGQSYTFRYFLADRERTLDGEDLEQFRHAMLGYLATHGITLR